MHKPSLPEHVYLHWPFCTSKCSYCDFISFQDHDGFEVKYHQALCKEIKTWSQLCENREKPLRTLFIGGGTPSLYPVNLLPSLFSTISSSFDCSQLDEVTIECNPSDIIEEKLDLWASLGINRISLGVQVLDDKALEILNRRQRISDVYKAMKLIPKYFSNISVDLMIGLPGVDQKTWQTTLEAAMQWPITHLSIYLLTVYEKTPLYFNVQQQNLSLPTEDEVVKTYIQTAHYVTSHNFEQYELSNFCRPGYASKHNKAYWNRKPYRGFGLNAASFDGYARMTNISNLTDYISQMAATETGVCYASTENLTHEQVRMEVLMLSLRQKSGLDLQSMVYLTKDVHQNTIHSILEQLEQNGLISVINNVIRLTPKGMVLENEVILKLI